ncbi:MAG: hypothetical protein J0G95_01665 [Rhizobiales bacterium]|nr:hypothetical protein [Hyphomicrobiales bacterium]
MKAAKRHCELKAGKGWQLSRDAVREARLRLRSKGDVHAAERLLRHSIACGHHRLVVHRFMQAAALGVKQLDVYEPYFKAAAEQLPASALAVAEEGAKSLTMALSASVATFLSSSN